MNECTVAARLCRFIAQAFLDDGTRIADDTRLLELRVLDSAAIFDVVDFIRHEFQVRIPVADIHPGNFDCVASLERLVERLATTENRRSA